jgi:5-oxoprolinase (ATP-hydrolysing)
MESLDVDALRPRLQAILDRGIRSLAVVFMHAYAWPEHELAVGRLAGKIGFTQISLSSQVMPMVKLVARGDTTMTDAYLNPHIQTYLNSFRQGFSGGLKDTGLLFMQSDGGLARADDFTGSRAILSGPAGGVVGYAMTTFNDKDRQPVIGFDMGGTSTDVSRFGGEYELVFETETAGVRIQAPQLQIKTVAAGGGSRLFFDNGMFMVGPESAGAHPGPVCYRKHGSFGRHRCQSGPGSPAARLFSPYFRPHRRPAPGPPAARAAMADLTRRINDHPCRYGQSAMSVEQVAMGFIRVANETMVRPIREISVMRGFDIKEHTSWPPSVGPAPSTPAPLPGRWASPRFSSTAFPASCRPTASAWPMWWPNDSSRPQKSTREPLPKLLGQLKAIQADAEKELSGQGFSDPIRSAPRAT